ncbi:MAG: trypsin-like peptidase domain-containing protein [Planctomycetes bacterium]|nr:trypsin-like peptidase domain-containing protein [Planctomycetota bacterium]
MLFLSLVFSGIAQANPELYKKTLRSTVWIRTPRGTGTGFVVDAEKRLVVTNYHVIRDFTRVLAIFPVYQQGELRAARSFYLMNSSKYAIKARVITVDLRRDLALLQLDRIPKGVPALKLAKSSVQPGERVHSIGNPGVSGALWVYTSGTVRQVYLKTMRMRTGFTVVAKVVETQSPINPGDSGGPVVNENGELVAITQSFRPGFRLVSSAIDVSELKELLAGKNKTMDSRLQKVIDELKLRYTISVAGNVRIGFGSSSTQGPAIYITNRTRKFSKLELRQAYAYVRAFSQPISQDIANLLLERTNFSSIGAWQISMRNGRRWVMFRATIPADADAATIRNLLDSMESSIRDMVGRMKKLEAARRAASIPSPSRTVVGAWNVVKQSSGSKADIRLELRSDKSFQYRIGDVVTLKGSYVLVGAQLKLTVGSNTLIAGMVKWSADGSFVVTGPLTKYAFRKAALKTIARTGK